MLSFTFTVLAGFFLWAGLKRRDRKRMNIGIAYLMASGVAKIAEPFVSPYIGSRLIGMFADPWHAYIHGTMWLVAALYFAYLRDKQQIR
jgi:hypothetical protein